MIRHYLQPLAGSLLLAFALSTAAADTKLSAIEDAFQTSDAAALSQLLESTEGMNKLVAQYRLAGLAMGNNQMEKAQALLGDLKNGLETETGAHPENAEAWALLASTYGMLSIGASPDEAMELGMKASEAESRALATGPENPMALLLIGINKFYTPEQWGGGASRAPALFERAVTAYQAGKLDRTWGHADALVWRGSTHAKLGNQTQAEADINAAVAMEPDYQWAKTVLDRL